MLAGIKSALHSNQIELIAIFCHPAWQRVKSRVHLASIHSSIVAVPHPAAHFWRGRNANVSQFSLAYHCSFHSCSTRHLHDIANADRPVFVRAPNAIHRLWGALLICSELKPGEHFCAGILNELCQLLMNQTTDNRKWKWQPENGRRPGPHKVQGITAPKKLRQQQQNTNFAVPPAMATATNKNGTPNGKAAALGGNDRKC